ncbi:MAG TPA: hypothetical protein VNX28_16035 [Gemmataceae bacterium]|nr:hypothetical protein [Gemmataceae bacterium]
MATLALAVQSAFDWSPYYRHINQIYHLYHNTIKCGPLVGSHARFLEAPESYNSSSRQPSGHRRFGQHTSAANRIIFGMDAASDRRGSGARGNRAPWSRQGIQFLHEDLSKNPAAILVIAFVADFSERFITGAIERISEHSSKTKLS